MYTMSDSSPVADQGTSRRRRASTTSTIVYLPEKMTEFVDEVSLRGAAEATKLLLWHDLPSWLQEGNHYIETGYRPRASSILDCIHSLKYLHNETVNIFSHAIGAVLFFAMPFYVFNTKIPPRYAVSTLEDKVACFVYFIGVAICFLFSTGFHVFLHHSPRTFSMGLKLDFQGVIMLMWGANIPLIYYGFVCNPTLQFFYWSLTTFLGALCSAVTFHPRFSDPHLRAVRAATFGALALSTFIPVFHGMAVYGYEIQSQRIGLQWVLATLAFNTLGASAYAFKFPERWFPRRFDIFGASHQIMHVLILIAGFMYAFAVLAEFDYRHAHPAQCGAAST
ncbi:hemolysin-III channel protein-like protein Izh2 [Podospora didyma]|uniref:Hemolysin-III channel protein-like protein Izh2 n=1 Tax=Podospora didyma TaxID=330526 RepID=A0AAE0TZQ1_9PEZI|nr:hemolysin-III channel protein-like protein Izh2 [Podospora didyma]